jgi:hypothetical protein
MSFISPDQVNFVIETNGILFGSGGSSVSALFKLDQTVIGTASLGITADPPTGAPFTLTVTNGNTPNPTLTVNITGIPVLGQNYPVTFHSGSNTDTLNVIFYFTETYQASNWTNSNVEENIGGYFSIQQIAQGAQLLSTTLNTKLRSLVQFISLLNTKITNFTQVYRIKKNLPDIINSAIFAGSLPAGYTGMVTYGNGTDVPTNAIATILLQDDISDADTFTLITFSYTSQTKVITYTPVLPALPVVTSSSYLALNSISVDRVANAISGVQYNIATVNVSRVTTTFTSEIDSLYSIQMPVISGWMTVG